MQRIPKYTAGMFKKKMPRFGASSIRMPRIPKPPKPKKFDGGGEVYYDINKYLEALERDKELKESKGFVKRYLSERKKADAAEAAKKADKDNLKKKFDEYMEDRKRQEDEGTWNYMQDMKKGARTARKGGVMKSSCCRGDGIAKKGKTRGKFI
jgi:hypothetical protein